MRRAFRASGTPFRAPARDCCLAIADLSATLAEGYALSARRGRSGAREGSTSRSGKILTDNTQDRIRAKHLPFDIA